MNVAAPAYARVEALGSAVYAAIYSGVRLSQDGRGLSIMLTKRDALAEAALRAAAGLVGDQVSVELWPMTAVQADELHARVTQDAEMLKAGGIKLRSWLQDYKTGMERLGVEALTSEQTKLLRDKYGSGVDVQDVDVALLPVLTDRENDTPAWNGGDFTSNLNRAGPGGDCTTGVPVHVPGATYMLTAGHCYAIGTDVYNFSSRIPRGTGNLIGRVAQRGNAAGNLDQELIFTSSSQLIYTGYTFGAARSRMAGIAGSEKMAEVCSDGAWEGQKCGIRVDANGCNDFIESRNPLVIRNYCNVLRASGSDPQQSGPGDSGGPVVRYVAGQSGTYVVGTITGGDGATAPCQNWTSFPRDCASNVWYTDIHAAVNMWGVALNQ